MAGHYVAQPSFHLVSDNRVAHGPGHDQTGQRRRVIAGTEQEVDNEMRPPSASPAPDGQGEVFSPPHPVPGRQHDDAPRRAPESSDRDARAALPAARGEDGAARARPHAQPEAVLLVAASVVRLVRTLAHSRLQCCAAVDRDTAVEAGQRCGPHRGPRTVSRSGGPILRARVTDADATRPENVTAWSPLRSNGDSAAADSVRLDDQHRSRRSATPSAIHSAIHLPTAPCTSGEAGNTVARHRSGVADE